MQRGQFSTEAEMVATFISQVKRHHSEWVVYAETAGWDLLLVNRDTGEQLGVEAKLSLNMRVINQALRGVTRWYERRGPDYRAVLVGKGTADAEDLCLALGVGVIRASRSPHTAPFMPEDYSLSGRFPHWAPEARCEVPDYVPDVSGGVPSPVRLSPWKVAAIKLQIILERRGYVTRADMRALGLHQSRWTDKYHGFLTVSDGVFVQNQRTPDFRGQHPRNFSEIEADAERWLALANISVEPRILEGGV